METSRTDTANCAEKTKLCAGRCFRGAGDIGQAGAVPDKPIICAFFSSQKVETIRLSLGRLFKGEAGRRIRLADDFPRISHFLTL